MKDLEEILKFEKLVGQLRGLHEEIGLLARKSSNDAVNAFKLRLINKVILSANAILAPDYLPIEDFEEFEIDDLPTNSDVALVLSQYIEETERYRSDNVEQHGSLWWYVIDGEASDVRTGPPAKVTKK